MKTVKQISSLFIVSILLLVNKADAQFYKDMSVGFNVGTYIYQGDLSLARTGSLETMKPGFALFAKKPINRFLDARLQMSFTRLVGDDSRYNEPDYRQRRNFKFSSPVREFTAQLMWNILGVSNKESSFMPYLYSGAGVAMLNVNKDYSRIDTSYYKLGSSIFDDLAADNAHGSPRSVLVVPIGAGAEISVSERVSLNMEGAYRFVFTDYLDGFSKAASDKYDDHYYNASIGIIYKFGAKASGVGCPRF